MLLTDVIRSRIPPDIRTRGEEYFKAGSVFDVQMQQNRIGGYVTGNEDYWVEILISQTGSVILGCDCIYFDDHGHCKHVWALAREADQLLRGQPEKMVALLRAVGAVKTLRAPDLPVRPAPPPPDWRQRIKLIQGSLERSPPRSPLIPRPPMPPVDPAINPDSASTAERRIVYVIDQTYDYLHHFTLGVRVQRRLDAQLWSPPRKAADVHAWFTSTDPVDVHMRETLGAAFGAMSYGTALPALRDLRLHPMALPGVLRAACHGRRVYVRLRRADHRVTEDDPILPLVWDADEPFAHRLHVEQAEGGYLLHLQTRRGEELVPAAFARDRAGPYVIIREPDSIPRLLYVEHGLEALPRVVTEAFPLFLPEGDATEGLGQLLQLPSLPPLSSDSQLPMPRVQLEPRPCLKLSAETARGDTLKAVVEFAYGDHGIISAAAPTTTVVLQSADGPALLSRGLAAEQGFLAEMSAAGGTRQSTHPVGRYSIRRRILPEVVARLVGQGWHVEADGKAYRSASTMRIKVSSGIDWLDLEGQAVFSDGGSASLPAILEAVRRRQNTVVLDDGTIGLLPEEWLKRYAPLAGAVGVAKETGGARDATRFNSSQALLLDALLAGVSEVDVDERFATMRAQLNRFDSIRPADPPATFAGDLREYQRAGLGWLQFLQQFGFGGCLADDMGLGKTIQVLALLDWRRQAMPEEGRAPSLVVVPRSLIFNWKAEAEKFAPGLRVLDHSHAGRRRDDADHLRQFDLVLTTYGTLRSDVGNFHDFVFDYVILDEAQAIKNAGTANAKAARLLRCRHRLAMSGTPIENHLGELWSLFEFLNPGMFGDNSSFRLLANPEAADGRSAIARTIRPLLLRRTKQQVARDLPERVEQTIFCDLDTKQRKIYDQLRAHYRALLGDTISAQGIEKSQIQILEALLRLRQAACHPALIDRRHERAGSAKLDLLMDKIAEAVEEGHKVLVFSQFTSLLAILRQRLDGEGVTYEYLDGQTRDRQARVDRFQSDAACPLFLISLKAGGVGLNLTAADYVFLLDPWWNPAVEAQAIDRTHRIGQQRTVFATRLIARDTVEEKVLELQKSKRDLADAIVGEAARMSNAITREDLALLLA